MYSDSWSFGVILWSAAPPPARVHSVVGAAMARDEGRAGAAQYGEEATMSA